MLIQEEIQVIKFKNSWYVPVTIGIALACALPGLAGQPAEANKKVLEDYFQAIGTDLAARRDSAMSTLLQLDEAEAKVFWPLKKAYDKELSKLFDARFEMLGEFDAVHDKLTLEKANELAERALALDEQRTELHRKYYKLMSEKISPITAVQFLQLQGQFETMADMKIATHVPLAMR